MDIDEIKRLIAVLQEAKISELTVSIGDTKVSLRKPLAAVVHAAPAAPADAPVVSKKAAAPEPEPAVYITAPMVGIFHSLDTVSAVGVSVKAGQVVGAIESMKLMNDVVSEHDGSVAEILVEDGMPVEYGQNLFRLEQRT